MTLTIDDAGVGDLLFGVVIGVFRNETREFKYEILDVKHFQAQKFRKKEYLRQASKIVSHLVNNLKIQDSESIHICKGYIFDKAVEDLAKTHSSNQILRVEVTGEPQLFTETAYLDELRNLGYEPLKEREKKRAKRGHY